MNEAGLEDLARGLVERARAAGADQVFTDMEELPALLGCTAASA